MNNLVEDTCVVKELLSKPMSATRFRELLSKNQITLRDYLAPYIELIEKKDPLVHAFTYFNKNKVLDDIEILENMLEKDKPTILPRLYGVPVAVKDIFNTQDMRTEHGSVFFKGYTPGNDARVVTNLRREKALLFGKTVTAEFAVHQLGETKNPHDHSRTPGTSSSGSAVAVAEGMVPLALASQTNGSTIRPSSYCGIIGFKPTFGVLPRTAMLKTADTLDTVGLMGAYLADIEMFFNTMRVRGPNYPIVDKKLIRYEKKSSKWRLGFLHAPYMDSMSSTLERKMQVLLDDIRSVGVDVDVFDLPEVFSRSDEIHRKIYHKSLSYHFKMEWEQNASLFSDVLSEAIVDGLTISTDSYLSACGEQHALMHAFHDLFQNYDLIMCPSALSEAPKLTDEDNIVDYNHLITLCHAPTVSLPLIQGDSKLPVGMQFVSERHHDYKVLDFCKFLLNKLERHAVS